jgi:hypothetical protein
MEAPFVCTVTAPGGLLVGSTVYPKDAVVMMSRSDAVRFHSQRAVEISPEDKLRLDSREYTRTELIPPPDLPRDEPAVQVEVLVRCLIGDRSREPGEVVEVLESTAVRGEHFGSMKLVEGYTLSLRGVKLKLALPMAPGAAY